MTKKKKSIFQEEGFNKELTEFNDGLVSDLDADSEIEDIEYQDAIELINESEECIDIEIEDDNYSEEEIENNNEVNNSEDGEYLTMDEKNALAEKDGRLVEYMAKKFINTGISEDELTGIAYQGYVKALNNYKKNKKTKFSTYACTCMYKEILSALRKEKKWSENVISIDTSIGVDKNGNALTIGKTLKEESSKDLDEMAISKDINALVNDSLKVLNETEKKIAKYRFGLCGEEIKKQNIIAKELGISQAYVSKLEKDCKLKIKKYIQEEDLKNGVLGRNSYFNY